MRPRRRLQRDHHHVGTGGKGGSRPVDPVAGDRIGQMPHQRPAPVPRGFHPLGQQRDPCPRWMRGEPGPWLGQAGELRRVAGQARPVAETGAQQAADPGLQQPIVDRKGQRIVDPRPERAQSRGAVVRRGQRDHRNPRQHRIAIKSRPKRRCSTIGERHRRDDQGGSKLWRQSKGIGQPRGLHHPVPGRAQLQFQHHAPGGVGVDDQNGSVQGGRLSSWSTRECGKTVAGEGLTSGFKAPEAGTKKPGAPARRAKLSWAGLRIRRRPSPRG